MKPFGGPKSAADESIRRIRARAGRGVPQQVPDPAPRGTTRRGTCRGQSDGPGKAARELAVRVVRPPRPVAGPTRLGHRDEARGELEAVRTLERTRIPRPGNSEFGRNWGDWLVMDVLRRRLSRLRDDSIKMYRCAPSARTGLARATLVPSPAGRSRGEPGRFQRRCGVIQGALHESRVTERTEADEPLSYVPDASVDPTNGT